MHFPRTEPLLTFGTPAMSSTTTRSEEQQTQWAKLVRDSHFNKLPYKVETNQNGQLVLHPRQANHAYTQGDVIALLYEHAEQGRPFPEFPITTDRGVKVPDVVWITADRREEMDQMGDPPTLAPEICIEIMSASNDWEEMHTKRALYRDAGAEEVWIVDADGDIHVFDENDRTRSGLLPTVPDHV